jgi:hypothetical protein
MQLVRPIFATNPRLFGRGRMRDTEAPAEPSPGLSADFKLFAATFLAGFLFVSILIG